MKDTLGVHPEISRKRKFPKEVIEVVGSFLFHSSFTHSIESWWTHWWAEWTAFLDATQPAPLLAFLFSCVLGRLITGRIQRWREAARKR